MSSSDAGGASIALQRSVRALDGVERIGRLLTLDLKGNEIKVSFSHLVGMTDRKADLVERSRVHCPGIETEPDTQGPESE
jgi:hypothetical protein